MTKLVNLRISSKVQYINNLLISAILDRHCDAIGMEQGEYRDAYQMGFRDGYMLREPMRFFLGTVSEVGSKAESDILVGTSLCLVPDFMNPEGYTAGFEFGYYNYPSVLALFRQSVADLENDADFMAHFRRAYRDLVGVKRDELAVLVKGIAAE